MWSFARKLPYFDLRCSVLSALRLGLRQSLVIRLNSIGGKAEALLLSGFEMIPKQNPEKQVKWSLNSLHAIIRKAQLDKCEAVSPLRRRLKGWLRHKIPNTAWTRISDHELMQGKSDLFKGGNMIPKRISDTEGFR
jgi:hypothetical protein